LKRSQHFKEAVGKDIHYLMLRGIFGAPEMSKDAVEWYVGFLRSKSGVSIVALW
jgi:hypothetical protein